MIWLGLDTSDKHLFVGLFKDKEPLGIISYEAWQRQSEYLISEMDGLFRKTGVSKRAIEAVVTSVGPGSYTGVRIGLTVAKTIAFALKIPLYSVSSLEMLQDLNVPSICLCNARSKRSYFGVYDHGEALVKDCIKTNDEVKAYIAEHPDYLLCGDLEYLGLEGKEYDPTRVFPSCLDEKHRCPDPYSLRPVYLKDDYDSTNMRVIVRKTIPSDLSTLADIEASCFSSPYTETQLLGELNENPFSHLYSALLDGEVVGYIDFMITFNSLTINRIAVKEGLRGKGIGNLLLGQMIKDAEAQKDEVVEFATLEVRTSNERAIRFYKKHKFEAITVKKGYYEDGEDAIYMVRSLVHG
ncbi:MAG: tRNA (adenosine(37)-N6)-threonylcarbamoyltransferase complex dimerization subunit type 1 TsaB [Bacilli bacterium]|nr:tRNA (adenosine(37)-N6)-threonylcarbamoyltransferase complex dimerization subunit type 1 TsaB [Bacilli bacterium]